MSNYIPDLDESKYSKQSVFRPTTRAEVALWYAERFGWLALPAIGKQPCVKWNAVDMPQLPPLDELAALWRGHDHAGIALLTGKRSGLVVADVDPRHGGRLAALWETGWPKGTPTVVTGSGGWHVYVSCPAGGLPSVPGYGEGIELKADGAIVIAPPSRHPDTQRVYEWVEGKEPWNIPLAELPEAVISELCRRKPERTEVREPIALTDEQVHGAWPRATALVREAVERARERRDNGRHGTLVWLSVRLRVLGLGGDPLRRCLVEYVRLVEKGWAE